MKCGEICVCTSVSYWQLHCWMKRHRVFIRVNRLSPCALHLRLHLPPSITAKYKEKIPGDTQTGVCRDVFRDREREKGGKTWMNRRTCSRGMGEKKAGETEDHFYKRLSKVRAKLRSKHSHLFEWAWSTDDTTGQPKHSCSYSFEVNLF